MIGKIKAYCPLNETHRRFNVTAHVTQDWMVDEDGNWIETVEECVDVTHSPDSSDIWTCVECGSQAMFKVECE